MHQGGQALGAADVLVIFRITDDLARAQLGFTPDAVVRIAREVVAR